MEAHKHSIEEILGKISGKQNFYIIPPYQREYTWGKKEWENLLVDILDNDINYFLGSIICIKNTNNEFDLIDGQQRLTTISILLSTIYDIISGYDEQHPQDDILNSRTHKKESKLFSLIEDLLVYENKPKLTLSLQKNNNDDYKYLLYFNGLLDEVAEPKNWGNRRIAKADSFFYNELNELLKENEIKEIFDFLEKLINAILIKIDVENVASAFTLFESINYRGKPLSPVDLIKNSIIKNLYNDYGENPEKINEKWQIIIDNIEEYKDQIRFLRHFYHAFKNDKFKLNYKKATISNLITIYQDLIKMDAKNLFKELLESAKIYRMFVNPYEEDYFYEMFLNLKRLGVAPSYALLLFLFRNNVLSERNMLEVLQFIEKWFIRRNLTNYPGTNKLDNIFINIIEKIYDLQNEEDIVKTIKDELLKPDKFMKNEAFIEFLKTKDLYEENAQVLKYLLIKLEKSKRTDENITNFWEKVGNKSKWSIEHILPQNPKKNSKWFELYNEKELEEYTSKLGNFTLTCYNQNLSNKEFNQKAHIKEKGKDIGLKSGNVKINDLLLNCEEWTKECIDKRTNILINEIIKLLKV